MRSLGDPDGAEPEPVRALWAAVEAVHAAHGAPSLRTIERWVRRTHGESLPNSTLSDWFRKHRVPAWERFRLLLGYYGEDEQRWLPLWHRAYNQADVPSQPGPAPVRQLPADVPDFTGRAAELDALDELKDSATVVVVAGAGGIGKTALAVRWGRRVSGAFPDGQLYVDLRGYSPEEPLPAGSALTQLITALGVPAGKIPAEQAAQAGLYRSLLADRRMLVVLDNAAHPEQVRPLLPGASRSLALVTSRSSLAGLVARDGARRITLDVLEPDEAVALLRRIVGAARLAREPAAATALADRCGHLPLALRIAAEHLAARPSLTLDGLLAELADEQRRLDLLATDDEDRSASVRSVLSWSYRVLSPRRARAFRLLGLHPGAEVSEPAAAALWGVSLTEARGLLERLAGVHLLETAAPQPAPLPATTPHPAPPPAPALPAQTAPAPPNGVAARRFRVHDLVRCYAAERVAAEEAESERRAALRRAYEWYLRTADAADRVLMPRRLHTPLPESSAGLRFGSNDEALAWLRREHANLIAAVEHAAATGEHALAWRLTAALWSYFYLQKPWSDWIAAHRIGLASAQAAQDGYGEAWTRHGLGTAYWDVGRHTDAVAEHRRALQAWRAIGNPYGEAMTLNNLAAALGELHRFDEALAAFRQALAVRREIGDRRGEGQSLNNLGEAHHAMGRLAESVEYFQQALPIAGETGNGYGEGIVLKNLGVVHLELADLPRAVDYLEQALAVRRDSHDRRGVAETLLHLGRARRARGELSAAGAAWRTALQIFTDLGDPQADEARALLSDVDAPPAPEPR